MPTSATRIEHFEHHGGTLVDEILGTGDTHLIFLHGWGGSRDSLRGIATLFQHTHVVHLIDQPGFGEAPLPPQDWSTINYTDLVQQYMLEKIAGPVLLIGHSFGGRVSVRLAARRLPQIRGVVLLSAAGLPRTGFSAQTLRRSWIRLLRKMAFAVKPIVGERAVAWHTRTYGSKDYMSAGELRAVFVRVVNEDLTESAAAIDCPVLLLWGTEDTETPVWVGERYKEILGSRATLEILPHKDHHLYTGTGAHLCGTRIRAWLKRQDAHV